MNLSSRRRARALLPGLAIAVLPLSVISVTASAGSAATTTQAAAASAAPAAPADGSVWSPTSAKPSASRDGNARTVNPREFRGYTLDDARFAAALAKAPLAGSRAARTGGAVEVVVPAPTGEEATFSVVESPTMQKRLQAKHPDIRTYVGNEATTGDSISLVVTPTGVHASVRGDHPSWYVDPAYQNDDSLYLSYFGQALPEPEKAFVEPKLNKAMQSKLTKGAQPRIGEGANGLVNQRVYRLAFLTDNTYAEYVAPGSSTGALTDAQSNSQVLAAKTLLMARVNQVYNDDLAVRMVLVNSTDKLNLNTAAKMTGANGPCGDAACFTAAQASGCTGGTLTRNRYVVGLLSGAENFDIGHIGFGLNGGGVASLGQVGLIGKAQGCTGLPQPIGDFYAIDYVAHEMGHQFNGPHTFNGTVANCSTGNRSAGSSVEPGSGSSVMAYAGICGSDDLQPHTDPYFSQRSQTDISGLILATPANLSEQQMVALSGYDTTKSFTLTFGSATTLPITGTATVAGVSYAYSAAGIKAAVEAAIGATVNVTSLYAAAATITTTGFTMTFAGALAGANVANAVLNPGAGVTGTANDIVKGGLTTNGGTVTATANHNPTVTAPAATSIPLRTPFTLTGSATDSDNDSLVYLWEQNDRGATGTSAGTALTTNTKLNGPLFRVFGKYANVVGADTLLYNSPGENLATNNPSRTFPDLDQILAGTTNAATGACPTTTSTTALGDGPVLECYSEFLPTSSYVGTAGVNPEPSLNFRLTARDQRANGGGTTFADVKLTLVPGTGPFQVTSQAAATSYDGGSNLPVTWDVNGTNTPALAQNVKISLSTDGGQTFPTVLAASTPNDGTESVVLPDVATSTARLKIEAVGNVFFDINDAPFTILKKVANQTAPSISGTPAVGSTLTADPGTYNPSDVTYAYQWYANNQKIDGATAQTFTPTAAQDGALVLVRVTASRSGFASGSANSSSVRIAASPITNTVAPVITGTATAGSTLTLSDGTWNYADLTYSYQWYAGTAAIRGANKATYVIPASAVGKAITGRVTATRPGSDAVVATSSNTVTPS